MNIFKKVKEKIHLHFLLKKDTSLARVEGYSRGVDDTTASLSKKITNLTKRIGELTEENLRMEEKLRSVYAERNDILEARRTKQCKECMSVTERERERLRTNQNLILDLIQKFNVVFMKIYKHANLVVDEHDTIIKSSGRVKASKDILLTIKVEADELIKKILPLTDIRLTEADDTSHLITPQLPKFESLEDKTNGNGKDDAKKEPVVHIKNELEEDSKEIVN